MRRRFFAVARKQIRGLWIFPGPLEREPARKREVRVGDQRREAASMAGLEHATVVLELGARKESLLRLDSRPLDRKAVGIEAKIGERVDILLVEMVVVARVS